MEKHERMFKEKLEANGILYQQAITSGRKFGNTWASKRNDIFGAFDFEIITKYGKIIFIQITSASNSSARKKKVYDNFISKLETDYIPHNIYVLSYKEKKQKGKKRKITLWHLSYYDIQFGYWVDVSLSYKGNVENWYSLDAALFHILNSFFIPEEHKRGRINKKSNIKRKNNNL